MSTAHRHTARRILSTVVLAVLSGAAVGNTIAGDVLGLSPAWQTTLWVLAALAGGALTWATTGDETVPARRGPAWGVALVVLIAISLVVLLREPAGYYAAGAVLLAGGIAAIALRRTE